MAVSGVPVRSRSDLHDGRYFMKLRQTVPGLAHDEQVAAARQGSLVEPAESIVEFTFLIEDGVVVEAESRIWILPEMRLWSSTVAAGDGVVLLHHAACERTTLGTPPSTTEDLLLDFGGPVRPYKSYGFVPLEKFEGSSASRRVLKPGPVEYEFVTVGRDRGTYTSRTEGGDVLFVQQRLQFDQIEVEAGKLDVDGLHCWE